MKGVKSLCHSLKVGHEEVVDLMSDGFNKEKVKKALRVVRIGGGNVEPNIMKTVNESVKELGEKWFTSEKIKLNDSEGKEFVMAVMYCTNVKGYLEL